MANANEILLKLKADDSELKVKLAKAGKSVDDFANDINKSSSKMTNAFKSIGTFFKAYIGGYVIKEMSRIAEESINVEKGFNNLARSAEGGSKALLKSIQQASAGMISQTDLMKSANLAIQLMGQDVIEKLPEMAKIATAIAKQQGKDAASMLDDLVIAAGRQSVMILDNLGISSVRAGQLMEEYAAKLGKTRDGLTEAEKRAAFFYAAMKAGNEILEQGGGITEDYATRVARLRARISDLVDALSRLFVPVLDKVVQLLSKIIDNTQEVIDKYNEFADLVDTGKVDIVGQFTREAIESSKWWQDNYKIQEKLYNDKYQWEQRQQELLAKGYSFEEIQNKKREIIAKELYKKFHEMSLEQQKIVLGITQPVKVAKSTQRTPTTGIGSEKDYINYSKEFKETAQKVAEGFEKIRQAAIAGDLQATAKAMEELQKQGLLTANTNTVFSQSIAQMAYEAKVQNIAIDELVSTFNNLEAATKQSLYEMLWGKNGWDKFQQAFKNIIKQLVADVIYLTAKVVALQAIMSTVGVGGFGGTGIAGKLLSKIFERGYIPSYAKGKIPAFPSGYIPQDHFLAFIGTKEAVMRKEATQANRDLLAWMNANNGQRLPLDINLTSTIQVDGHEIGRVVDKYRDTIQSLTGYKNYYRKSL